MVHGWMVKGIHLNVKSSSGAWKINDIPENWIILKLNFFEAVARVNIETKSELNNGQSVLLGYTAHVLKIVSYNDFGLSFIFYTHEIDYTAKVQSSMKN